MIPNLTEDKKQIVKDDTINYIDMAMDGANSLGDDELYEHLYNLKEKLEEDNKAN